MVARAGAEAFLVRRLTDPARLPEVLRLLHEAFGALVIDPPSGALKESVSDLADRLHRETLLVAEAEGVPAGSVFCVPQGDALYIGRLAVAGAWRWRGVGRALTAAAAAEAERIGARRMTLRVRVAMPGNVRFFVENGFAIVGEGRHPGYAVTTFYEMEKRLARRASCGGRSA
jgi:predicted N-acetyltransferase YhbS